LAIVEVVAWSGSPEETRAIAAALAASLRPGDVVALSGDLGAGKTCFVQGAAAALGVPGPVTSPSFVLVREYDGTVAGLRHVDVYRLNSIQELVDLGYEDVFEPDRIVFIEWGDAVQDVLPDDRLEVDIRREGSGERRLITIRGADDRLVGLRLPVEVTR